MFNATHPLARLDPNHAKSELKITGLTSDEAARNAMKYYQYALSLNPDDEAKAEIQSSLYALHERFPAIPSINSKRS